MAKTSKRKSAANREQLIGALFTAAERVGWRPLTMAVIAEEAGSSLKEVLAEAATKYELLCLAIRETDRKALREIDDFTDDESTRDRLFALLMARFDAMAPHRDGIRTILRKGLCDPLLHLTIAVQGTCSMSRMLEAAGVTIAGPVGLARAKGLALVNANAVRTWLDDDSTDRAKTMATLDKGLAQAETIARSLDPAARRRNRGNRAETTA